MGNMGLVSQAHDRLLEVEKLLCGNRPGIFCALTDNSECLIALGVVLPILCVKALNPATVGLMNYMNKDLFPDSQVITPGYIIFGNILEGYKDAMLMSEPYPQIEEAVDEFVFAAIWQRIRAEFEASSTTGVASPNDVMLYCYERLREKGSHLDLLEQTMVAVKYFRNKFGLPEDGFLGGLVQFDIPKQVESLMLGRIFARWAKAEGLENACRYVVANYEKWLTPPEEFPD